MTLHRNLRMENRNICYNCIKETYLQNELKRKGVRITCLYCGKVAKGLSILELATKIEKAFKAHYDFHTVVDTLFNHYLIPEPVLEAIINSAQISREVAETVLKILEAKHYDKETDEMGLESEFDSNSCYCRKSYQNDNWLKDWNQFEINLRTNKDIFNDDGKKILDSIFENIDKIKSHRDEDLIIEIGPGCQIDHLFRARVFQSDENLKSALRSPEKEIGPVPSFKASSGRMNAENISVFYGSNFTEVAIAEVRPPVGSKVLVGKFFIKKKLRVLNLNAFSNATLPGSIFDETYVEKLEKVTFLRTLRDLITRPVMPSDSALDYLPTQAIANYLASNPTMNLDGILYPSIQFGTNDYNVILFNKVAKLKESDISKDIDIKVNIEEPHVENDIHSYKVYYTISELYSKEKKNSYPNDSEHFKSPEYYLELDLDCLHVYRVYNVRFDTDVNYVEFTKTSTT